MYILVDKSRILLGVFTSMEKLKVAANIIKEKEGGKVYYQMIEPDTFDRICINFFTMHPEKLNIIE